MNWVLTSFLMFFSSIIYYLIIKKAQIEKIENKLYMLFNFSVPGVIYLLINIINKQNIFINPLMLFYIFLSSLFLSYLGSVISYIAISKAPNAGYSLMIQKSNAVYTSIIAVYLFNSELNIRKYLAIILIIISTTIISITRGKKLTVNNYSWVILSLIAFFCFGTLRLTNKLFVSTGIPTTVLLFWTMVFVSSISLIDFLFNRNKIKTKLTTKNIFILISLGISVSSFYYFLQYSEVIAPNLGYVGGLNTASNAFYTVLVALIFKDHLTWKKLIGVLGVTAGLILLMI